MALSGYGATRIGAVLLGAGLVAGMASASAQGRLEARYIVSLAGVPIGKATWTIEADGSRYAAHATGGATGLLSVLFDGEGSAQARGTLEHGRPVPGLFVARSLSATDRAEVAMRIEHGAVSDLNVTATPPQPDTVPLTPADRLGVTDPLTALLLPMAGAFDVLSADICRRTLPVFDGRRRYDLRLSYKRMERIRTEQGYSGPAIVCAMAFQAHAGHRAGSALVKFLSEGRDMELWLAPVPGTRMLAPYRATAAGMLGRLVVHAVQFETQPLATASAHGIGQR